MEVSKVLNLNTVEEGCAHRVLGQARGAEYTLQIRDDVLSIRLKAKYFHALRCEFRGKFKG